MNFPIAPGEVAARGDRANLQNINPGLHQLHLAKATLDNGIHGFSEIGTSLVKFERQF